VAGLAVLVVSAGLVALGPGRTDRALAQAAPADAMLSPRSPIQHVVIVYQENHTFDDLLGAVCQTRGTPCDGYTGPVTFADGTTARNVVQDDLIPNVAHDPHAQRLGMSGRWNRVVGCRDQPYYCISHVDPANIPNLAALANTFTVSDATFAAGQAASFGAHVTLGAGTFDGFSGWNPTPGIGWGCQVHADALWGKRQQLTLQPTCIPNRHGDGPYRPSEVPYTPTIMQRMEQAGLSWHIYEGRRPQAQPDVTNFSVCTYFFWCYDQRFTLEHDSSSQGFLNAAADGTLPNLSILIPDFSVSQHNTTSMAKGDNYIGQIVSAAQRSPQWRSTAIFITYDDCGCFYDHVTPPSKQMGLRNPMVIVSPWAKPQGTDSTTAIQPYSVLAFVEHVFGLQPLSREVSESYDYADSFDFSQRPLTGPPMTRRQIPPLERRQLARALPTVRQDPT